MDLISSAGGSTDGAGIYFYPEWNPYNYTGNLNYLSPRGFMFEYAQDSANWPNANVNSGPTWGPWQPNTYDRLSFWYCRPQNASPLINLPSGPSAGDNSNLDVGTYCKSLSNVDTTQDEDNDNHFYHALQIPANGIWTQVILNEHPDHQREISGDVWNLDGVTGPHFYPERGSQYNYFDTMTRFYIQENSPPSSYPAQYLFADFVLYHEPYPEDDLNIYSLTSNYNPSNNDLILTWNHNWNDGTSKHQVYYAFQDIHQIGLANATPAPSGLLTPPNNNGYDTMYYETTALPLAGHSAVYIAIQCENSTSPAQNLFTEIKIPLTGLR